MKLRVFSIIKRTPYTEDEKEKYCEIFNIPSLKYGSINVLGEQTGTITKSELNRLMKVSARYYDESIEAFREGVLILDTLQFVETI